MEFEISLADAIIVIGALLAIGEARFKLARLMRLHSDENLEREVQYRLRVDTMTDKVKKHGDGIERLHGRIDEAYDKVEEARIEAKDRAGAIETSLAGKADRNGQGRK